MAEAQPPSPEADDPYLLTREDRRRLLRTAPWARFVVVGDGVTKSLVPPLDGYGSRSWPDRLADELREARPNLVYLNLGRRRLPAARVRARQLEPALQFKPDLALVLIGGCDLLQPTFDIDAVEIELARIISALRGTGCHVVTRGLFDITGSPQVREKWRKPLAERIALLAERTEAVCGRFGASYVDLRAHPAKREAIYDTDALSLNGRGHAIVACEVVRRLGQYLGNGGSAYHRPD